MIRYRQLRLLATLLISLLLACTSSNVQVVKSSTQTLTIFCVNDVHGEIDNFSKIKYIVDEERKENNVLVVCGGDIFSGNPVVDNAAEQGAPLIDLMNRVGFDVMVLGNHEFDYGQEFLRKRMLQSNFPWICANIDMSNSDVPQTEAFTSIIIDELKITFLGLIQTYTQDERIIPSTHPTKVENIAFKNYSDVIGDYTQLKEEEEADLLIALTHLGYNTDVSLIRNNPIFDLLIGGHSHSQANELVNNTHLYQTGSKLKNLGKIKLKIRDKQVVNVEYTLIDLSSENNYDTEMQALIDDYNDLPYLKEIIGFSHANHSGSEVGCFYCEALNYELGTDLTFQNTGGVRSGLDYGDITRRETFEISPFKNGVLTYSMTVAEIKQFLIETGSGFYYSGIKISKNGNQIELHNLDNKLLSDNEIIKLGINDFIPAVHPNYFPNNGLRHDVTAAETLMEFLENGDGQVDYDGCNRYFRYE